MKNVCKECQRPLQGRSDKKFCDDYCRVSYHSKSNRDNLEVVRQINKILKKNRQILQECLQKYGNSIPRKYLEWNSFKFQFYTHLMTYSKKETIKYCYDLGIAEISQSEIKIFRDQCSIYPINQEVSNPSLTV
jgi:hypothetical protein